MELGSYQLTSQQRLGLVGEVCPHCSAKLFPPRDVCPKCGGPAKTEYRFSGRGTVYSFATVYTPPERFASCAPYTVALVKLEEGPLVTAQLTDMEIGDAYIGMPVEMITRRMYQDGSEGLIVYNYKFRPLLESALSAAEGQAEVAAMRSA